MFSKAFVLSILLLLASIPNVQANIDRDFFIKNILISHGESQGAKSGNEDDFAGSIDRADDEYASAASQHGGFAKFRGPFSFVRLLAACTPDPIVTNSGDSGPGSLRQAVIDACAGSTITFDVNVASPVSLSTGQIIIDKNITVSGPGASLMTVQNTAAISPTSRVFRVESGVAATISGITITGGKTSGTFSVGDGGGIWNFGSMTVIDSVISGNSSASTGGGILSRGSVTIMNSTISGNSAPTIGGGLEVPDGGTVIISNSTLSGNTAPQGAGIGLRSATTNSILRLTNTTISGNGCCSGLVASTTGGSHNVTIDATNSTIVNNIGGSGSGIAISGLVTLNLKNSIVANNTGVSQIFKSGAAAAANSLGYNLISDASLTAVTGDQLNTDPMLAPLGNNGGPTATHAFLSLSSPAIDRGNNSGSGVSTDQRGLPRPSDFSAIPNAADGSDIGAYEEQTPVPVVTAPANQASNEGTSKSFNLGSFTDPDNGPWTVVVSWGDASPDTLFNAPSTGSLGTQNHTFVENGTYTVLIQITDSTNLTGTATFQVTVGNVAPAFTGGTISATNINENDSINLTINFADPGTLDIHTVSIDWDGDGTFDDTFVLPVGDRTLTKTHIYVDDAPTATPQDVYFIKFRVTDDDAGQLDSGFGVGVVVKNVAPAFTGSTLSATKINENDPIDLTVNFADPGTPDIHNVSIDWNGDSLFDETFTLAVGARTFTKTHVFLDDAPTVTPQDVYFIKYRITDDDSGQLDDTIGVGVVVKNVVPSFTSGTLSATNINENDSVDMTINFADPGTLDSHTVSIDWEGDGIFDDTFGLPVGDRTFTKNHLYPDDNPSGTTQDVYFIRYRITDDDAGQLDFTFGVGVIVKDVAPTAAFSNDSPYVFGAPGSVSFANQSDISPGDIAAGFHYSFDFDNDGTFEIGDGTYGGSGTNGAATVPPAYLASVGTHTVRGRILDDDLGFTDYTTNITVIKADTTTSVASSVNPSTYGQNVAFTATVTPVAPGAGAPTGSVTFVIDGTYISSAALSAGNATINVTTLGVAGSPHTITTQYNGDANFNTSNGALTGGQIVNKANTTTSITNAAALDTASNVSQPYAVNWTVTPVAPGAGTPTGFVSVTDGTDICLAAVVLGTCDLTSTTSGMKTITATYAGDPSFTSSSGTAAHTVLTSISGNIKLSPANTNLQGSNVSISGTAPLPAATTTDVNGNFTFTGLTNGGSYTITPSMSGKAFDPLNRTINNLVANVTNADFVAYNGSVPRELKALNAYAMPGQPAVMPLVLTGLGNEVTERFSLNYDVNLLTAPSVTCGTSDPGCSIATDNSQPGKIGVTVTPATQLAAGPRNIATVTFQTFANEPLNTAVTFGTVPTPQMSTDSDGNPLQTAYTNAMVVFGKGVEGDVIGHFAGSGSVDASDIVGIALFVAGPPNSPTPTFNEFQRADCAPNGTKGDGQINASDIVQASRYAGNLDGGNQVPAGGIFLQRPSPPALNRTERSEGGDEQARAKRTMRVVSVTASPGSDVELSVELDSRGDEVASSFTLNFDAAKLRISDISSPDRNPDVSVGADTPSGTGVTVNAAKAAKGQIGIVVFNSSLIPFSKLTRRQVVTLHFRISADALAGLTPVTFGGSEEVPTQQSMSDANANPLKVTYVDGEINIIGTNSAFGTLRSHLTNAAGQGLRGGKLIGSAASRFQIITVPTGGLAFY